MPSSILAIDGHSLLYRAYFALPDTIRDHSDRPVNGIHGFITMLARLLREHQPDGLLVAFDSPWPTLRHATFPEYKAKRGALPPALLAQVPLLQTLLQRIGITGIAIAGYEGDDILASLANKYVTRNVPVMLVSGDRDLFQLVRDPWIRILYTRRGVGNAQILNENGIERLVGVPPSRYGDLAALRGDPADNIAGIPGIGEKGALEIIRAAPSLDELYLHLEMLPERLQSKFVAARSTIETNLKLMRPIPTLPIDWESVHLMIDIDRDEAKSAFAELGLIRACESLLASLPTSDSGGPDIPAFSSEMMDSLLEHPRKICLISCSSTKSASKSKAKDLYTSALFKKSRKWAEIIGSDWYILSAKHGLVAPESPLAPYDESLKDVTKQQRDKWGEAVFKRLQTVARPSDLIFFLAGSNYSDVIMDSLLKAEYRIAQPLGGMSIGRRLRWLDAACSAGEATADLERFYEILSRLASCTGGLQPLATANQRNWPERGVYFFFEDGEDRSFRCQNKKKRLLING